LEIGVLFIEYDTWEEWSFKDTNKSGQTAKPAPFVMAGMQIVPTLQTIMMDSSSHFGLKCV
jgi:hypothetical protein